MRACYEPEILFPQTVERSLPVVGVGSGRGGGGGGGKGGDFNPAIDSEEEKREFFDAEAALTRKLDRAADWLRASKHAIVFTGAGISTRFVQHSWPRSQAQYPAASYPGPPYNSLVPRPSPQQSHTQAQPRTQTPASGCLQYALLGSLGVRLLQCKSPRQALS